MLTLTGNQRPGRWRQALALPLGLALLFAPPAIAAPASEADLAKCANAVKETGVPKYKGDAPEATLLCREGYLLSHNTDKKTPDWVVERLMPPRFSGPGDRNEQGNPFAPDPDLAKGKRAELVDYKKSGYDRGHMAPAADMKFSERATEQSFYLSNMSPQIGPNMNRGIWADLEGLTRSWACERGDIVVWTGPIYGDKFNKAIGPNEVAVPDAFYKVAYDPRRSRAIAFILPNEGIDKQRKQAWDVLKSYVVSVQEVEDRVGIDFLPKLKPREKRRLESLKSVMWPVRSGCPG